MSEVHDRPYFFDLEPDQLRDLVGQWGMPPFRAKQLLEWVYAKHVADPQLMSNLSKADREMLAERMIFTDGRVVQHQLATDGVQKLLVQWDHVEAKGGNSGGNSGGDSARQTECVLIPSDDRQTACISSQVGCPVGCQFCASGLGGLDGNLTAGQIVEQVWRLGTLEGVGRVSHVVFMGMGEPLANFENVTRALRFLMADWGLNIGGRKITVSTVGLPAQIRRLADLELQITLALSLHAPNDGLRRQLIPWAENVTIDQLVEACKYYFARTGRELTLEYVLLRGVNDREEHAEELVTVARRLRANINLIRYNEVKDLPFNRPDSDDVRRFQAVMQKAGINTHIRASRGRDIAAACGQLRHEQAGG